MLFLLGAAADHEIGDWEMDVTYHQINIFELLQNDIHCEEDVKLTGACKYEKGQLHEYSVNMSYADIVLVISALYDYAREMEKVEGALMGYYRERFREIANQLEQGIDYDYEMHLEKCRKGNAEKDDRIGVGENWIGA